MWVCLVILGPKRGNLKNKKQKNKKEEKQNKTKQNKTKTKIPVSVSSSQKCSSHEISCHINLTSWSVLDRLDLNN